MRDNKDFLTKEQLVDEVDLADTFWKDNSLENDKPYSVWKSCIIDLYEKCFSYNIKTHGDIAKTIKISGTKISKVELESCGHIIFSKNFESAEEVTIDPEVLLIKLQYMKVRLKVYAESIEDINVLYILLNEIDRRHVAQNKITHNKLLYDGGCVKTL
jgi:hypothetical protein